MEQNDSLASRQTYSVAAAAALVGVAPATLRTWARRHNIGPSGHATGSHRRYTDQDITRLIVMRALVVRGSQVSEAAASSHDAIVGGLSRADAQQELAQALAAKSLSARELDNEAEGPSLSQPTARLSLAGKLGESSGSSAPTSATAPQAVAPMPRLLTLAPSAGSAADDHEHPDYKHRCTQLVDAVLRADEDRAARLIELAPEENLIDWFKFLIRPALARLASHTVLARPGHSPKVMISYQVQRNVARRIAQTRPDLTTSARPHPSQLRNIALVMAPQRDKIAVPAHVFAAALLEFGCNAHLVLGPGNTRRVTELVKMVRPKALVLVSDLPDPDVETVIHVSDQFPELPIFVGLPQEVDLTQLLARPQVTSMRSFRALFHEVSSRIGGAGTVSDYWDEPDTLVSQ